MGLEVYVAHKRVSWRVQESEDEEPVAASKKRKAAAAVAAPAKATAVSVPGSKSAHLFGTPRAVLQEWSGDVVSLIALVTPLQCGPTSVPEVPGLVEVAWEVCLVLAGSILVRWFLFSHLTSPEQMPHPRYCTLVIPAVCPVGLLTGTLLSRLTLSLRRRAMTMMRMMRTRMRR
jgi:hypothetical protein